MAEPLGVAFVEIEPVAPAFRAKTEAQVRSALTGVSTGIPPSPQTAAATRQVAAHGAASAEAAAAHARETAALERKAAAAGAVAGAEGRAATATSAHAAASTAAARGVATQAAGLAGLSTAATGIPAPLAAGAVAAAALFKSLGEADDFNAQMHAIEVSTGASADEMERAAEAAVRLGRDLNIPLTTAVDAATAINLLTRSGQDLEGAMSAARGALLLTAASGEDLQSSVAVTDQILDAFNLRAEDSVRVADALATGMRFTGGNAAEFGQALATLAPIADSLGLSLEETNTLVLQLTESGISASTAAGGLRTSLLRLSAGGEQVNQGLARIGLTTDDLVDSFGDLRPDAFVRLGEALEGVNREQQIAILAQIFSRRSALAVIRIVDQQRAGYDRMAAAARNTGVAQEEAESRTRSFRGSLSEAKDEASDTARVFGDLATGPATELVDTFRLGFQVFNDTAFAIGALGSAARDLGGDLASAVPGGEQILDIVRRFGVGALFPVKAFRDKFDVVGDAFSGLVGRFRGDSEDAKVTFSGLADSIEDSLGRVIDAISKAQDAAEEKVATTAPTLATQLAVAEAGGNEQEQLRILRQQRARAQQRLARNQRRLASGEVGQAAVQQAAADVAAANAAIETIMAGQAAEAQRAAAEAERRADEIERAADERDAAFIRAQEAQLRTREGAVTVAAGTEPLADDIRANVRLRRSLTTLIEGTRERIQQVRAAGRDAEALVTQLAGLRRSKNAVRREIERLQADAAAQAAATRVESAQLDVELAGIGITEGADGERTQASIKREIGARQRLIGALKNAQSRVRKGTVEWKRLRNDIAAEQAAIADLRKTREKERGDALAFRKAEFEFAQTLQGFSANLISNLIPGGMTGGLVGGGASRPSTTTSAGMGFGVPRPTNRPALTAARERTVSAGQGNTQIELLRQILRETRRANQSNAHPEASNQRRRGSAAGDYQVQGTHGM